MLLGIVIYFTYGIRNSRIGRGESGGNLAAAD